MLKSRRLRGDSPQTSENASGTSSPTLDAMRLRADDAAFDGRCDAIHRFVDLSEAFVAIPDRQIGQIDVGRQTR